MKRKQRSIFSKLDEIELEKKEEENNQEKFSIGVSAAEADIATKEPKSTDNIQTPRVEFEEIAVSLTFEALFVYIPPGTFMMGSPEFEAGRNQDEIIREVTLTKGFYIQVTLVTQKQWISVMGSNPSAFLTGDENLPVEGISWFQCQEFIKKLSTLHGEVYRLPTEAEWEYACRAGTSSPFYSGEISSLYCGFDSNLDAVGWYCGNSHRKTHPVAMKKPNDWGLYDMHGNLFEWCSDWYGEYSEGPQTDPSGPTFGPGRVIRGGSWFSNAKNCRSACRYYWSPHSKTDFIGFRLVKDRPQGQP